MIARILCIFCSCMALAMAGIALATTVHDHDVIRAQLIGIQSDEGGE